MKKLQKLILVSLVSISAVSWIMSVNQPDMMSIMISYNPVLIGLFTASWTAGMAAMMFPAIVPMVLLYNKLLTNEQSLSSVETLESKFSRFKMILFVGMYLLVWALTGVGLLLVWSVPMNYVIMSSEANNTGIIFGGILIISGIYQFTSLKNKCIGYCESPLSFFMRRWSNGVMGAIKMGAFHGLYCLGCCWPYFLIMVSLGWMSVTWMALFAAIIFGEKIWSRGIWIARSVGIILILLGILSSLGVVTIYDNMTEMNLNAAEKMVM
jgi:predicted metal-binding membrane protein